MRKVKILSFASTPELQAWLAKNHRRSDGILLRVYKKDSGMDSVSYAEHSTRRCVTAGSMDRSWQEMNNPGCKHSPRGGRKADGRRKTPSMPNASSSQEK